MKLLRKKHSYNEGWTSYEDTETYRNYMLKKNNRQTLKEVNDMEVEVHSKLDIDYEKTLSTISFFIKSALDKFSKKGKWKLEVWLDEKSVNKNPIISCGVVLIRPNKNAVFAKKFANSLREATKKSLDVVERSIRTEKKKWNKQNTFQTSS